MIEIARFNVIYDKVNNNTIDDIQYYLKTLT